MPEQQFALVLLTNAESASPLVNELFADDWALRLFTGLANPPAPPRLLSSAELAPYEGRYQLQQVDAAGRLTGLPPVTVTARGGGLAVRSGRGHGALLTFYDTAAGPDYALVLDAGGAPRGTRADFLRDAAGQVRWLRLNGRLHQHVT